MIKDLDVKLRVTRDMKRLQQKDVAEKLNISRTSMSSYETGDVTPTVETLLLLANFYNVSLDYLCGNEKEMSVVTEGLTESQISAMQVIADEYRKANNDIK